MACKKSPVMIKCVLSFTVGLVKGVCSTCMCSVAGVSGGREARVRSDSDSWRVCSAEMSFARGTA